MSVFWSNVVGALVAISYVFVVSTNKIFVTQGSKKRKYLLYLLFQAVAIPFYSYIVEYIAFVIAAYDHYELIAKIVATPVSLLCNFVFMSWLTNYGKNNEH